MTVAFEHPWLLRVKQIEQEASASVEAQREVAKLRDDARDMARAMREKEARYEESTVKMDLLEKRLATSLKSVESLRSLEAELAKSRRSEKQYEQALEALQADLDRNEAELAKARAAAPAENGQHSSPLAFASAKVESDRWPGRAGTRF